MVAWPSPGYALTLRGGVGWPATLPARRSAAAAERKCQAMVEGSFWPEGRGFRMLLQGFPAEQWLPSGMGEGRGAGGPARVRKRWI